jgi:predicted dehydrogenase
MNGNTWLIGCGNMAQDYAKVLRQLEVQFTIIGRGEVSASLFEDSLGLKVERGGLESFLHGKPHLPSHAIVSVGIENLASCTSSLAELGIKNILVEKPAGLDASEINDLAAVSNENEVNVYVAYNRRFYSSVIEARKLIEEDGGVRSFNFEFTEWGHEIETLQKAAGVKERWVFGNSSHVIDLAFFLGGKPVEVSAFHGGSLDWHPASSVFTGAGRTIDGKLFSYCANWDAPGRWGLEFCTKNYRLIFRPMETLQVMRKGSVSIEAMSFEGQDLDNDFKPGLFLQTKAFLEDNEQDDLCMLSDHVEMLHFYSQIAGY